MHILRVLAILHRLGNISEFVTSHKKHVVISQKLVSKE